MVTPGQAENTANLFAADYMQRRLFNAYISMVSAEDANDEITEPHILVLICEQLPSGVKLPDEYMGVKIEVTIGNIVALIKK